MESRPAAAPLGLSTVRARLLVIHRPVRYTNADLGIHDVEVCVTCHAIMDEPDDWPESRAWPFPLVQERYPCRTVQIVSSVSEGDAPPPAG